MNGTLYVLESSFLRNDYMSSEEITGTITTSGETLIEDSYFEHNKALFGAAITSLGNLNSDSYTLEIQNSTSLIT